MAFVLCGGVSAYCDNFNFHKYTLGKFANGYGLAGRVGLCEYGGVYLVHGAEIFHIR